MMMVSGNVRNSENEALKRLLRLGAPHDGGTAWLNGTLLRTGPCKFEVGDRSYNHWFDGLAMLHRFTFADGQISYANRFVRGHTFCEAERRGRISYAEFATDPCRTLFGKIAA